MESWSAVETALRSLVGGTTLSGQPLIREARQRQLLSFEQANALAEFHAANERAHATDYEPTASDLDAARDAFLKFESGLMADQSGAVTTAPTTLSTEGMRSSPLGAPEPVPPPRDGLEPDEGDVHERGRRDHDVHARPAAHAAKRSSSSGSRRR